jgi:hypothetical protein
VCVVARLAVSPAFRRDVGLGLVDALDDRMQAPRGRRLDPWRAAAAIADTLRNAPVEWIVRWCGWGPPCGGPARAGHYLWYPPNRALPVAKEIAP